MSSNPQSASSRDVIDGGRSVNYSALPTSEVPTSEGPPTWTIPARFWIAFMAFAGSAITFNLRANMSINILAMVEPVATNGSVADLPNYGPRFPWSAYEQSAILGAFFYGSTLAGIPCGLLVDRFGCVRTFMFWGCVVATLIEFLSPVAASSFALMFAGRVLLGMSQGVMYPGMHKLFSKWAPPNELGKFTSTMMGGNFGTIASWAISGALIESLGWQYSFYGGGVITLVFCAVWWYLVFDSPAEHPRIAAKEREYIENCLLDLNDKPSWAPVLKLITSGPALALIVLQYGNLWGFLFVITGAPKFMNEILGFNLTQTGFLASLPYLARWLGGILFAILCDYIRQKNCMSLMNLRRLFCVFSHIIPGLFLAAMPYVGSNPYACVAFMTLSFGFNGAVTQTAFANIHDLTPNYAASLLSIANCVGGTSGFVTPLVVAYFTAGNNTFEGWRNVFLIGAVIYILPALVFMWLGSASVQPWNGEGSSRRNEHNAEADTASGAHSPVAEPLKQQRVIV